jgi:hypothetical protein
MALGGGIGCKPKTQPQARQPEAQVHEVVEMSLEDRAKFQERRKAETKTVKALYEIICAADPVAKSNFETYQGRDESLVALDGLLHCGKLKESELSLSIKMARDQRGGGDVFKFIHRGGENPYKGFALAGCVIWVLSGRELNSEFKKYNWIDFVKDGGKDFHLRVTPAITGHVEELWGREFDIKRDCLMEVLVPPGVVEECRAGAKRWLDGNRPLPRAR